MVRGAIAVTVAIVVWGNHALAADDLGPLYRPADGWVGEAIIRDVTRPATPACSDDSNLDTLQQAIDVGDVTRAQSMSDVCVMIPNESYGEIIGATASGDYLRLRMIYVHGFRDLDGIEVFIPVTTLRNLSRPDEGMRAVYDGILGRS